MTTLEWSVVLACLLVIALSDLQTFTPRKEKRRWLARIRRRVATLIRTSGWTSERKALSRHPMTPEGYAACPICGDPVLDDPLAKLDGVDSMLIPLELRTEIERGARRVRETHQRDLVGEWITGDSIVAAFQHAARDARDRRRAGADTHG